MVGFRAYPNPTADNLELDWVQKNTGTVRFSVLDLSGKAVWTHAIQDVKTGRVQYSLPVSNAALSTGVYILRVESADQMHYMRFNFQR